MLLFLVIHVIFVLLVAALFALAACLAHKTHAPKPFQIVLLVAFFVGPGVVAFVYARHGPPIDMMTYVEGWPSTVPGQLATRLLRLSQNLLMIDYATEYRFRIRADSHWISWHVFFTTVLGPGLMALLVWRLLNRHARTSKERQASREADSIDLHT